MIANASAAQVRTGQRQRVTQAGDLSTSPTARPQGFRAANWRPHQKNTLQGFLDLELPSGLVLRECSYHARDGKAWIGLPSKPQIGRDGKHRADENGKLLYAAIIDFATKEARERFHAAALQAVRVLLGQGEERLDAALFP
jgi:hypothetical protein